MDFCIFNNVSRETSLRLLWTCLLTLSLVVQVSLSQDVIGCGGFVKSEVAIDFTRVEVKLYTVQGVLKYHTDCAPNNGYYLIPVYDKGDYVLKVEPPKGWLFEPTSVSLKIDGQTDVCSLSKDINFQFKGFSIIGQVISRGSSTGPSGVLVHLCLASSPDKPVQVKKTDATGAFSFSLVTSGDYIIRAASMKWQYDRNVVPISVTSDNGYLKDKLVVSGYEVSGRVVGDGDEPITGVSFVLFGMFDDPADKHRNCEPGLPKDMDASIVAKQKPRIPLCHVTSSYDGHFVFPLLIPGKYSVVPFYRGQNIKFDVNPSSVEFEVLHEAIVLRQIFKVEGFSVSGRVSRLPNGKGVVGVTVLLDGKKVTTTEENGVFRLENIKAGSYKIQIVAEKMQFAPRTIKITPNTPNIPDLVATSFEVCGTLISDRTTIGNNPVTVSFSDVNGVVAKLETDTDTTGNFCIWLPPGTYSAHVEENSLTPQLLFKPDRVQVDVIDSPVSGIQFKQFTAKVTGNVICLENCDGIVRLSLRSLETSYLFKPVSVYVKNAKFQFNDVLPGSYQILLEHELWCWLETHRVVHIKDKDVSDVSFKQNGYLLTVIASHQTILEYHVSPAKVKEETSNATKKDVSSGELHIAKGNNRICLDRPGIYEFHPVGCHIFTSDIFAFNTSSPSILVLDATRHLLSGTISSGVHVTDVKIAVRITVDDSIGDNGEEAILGPLLGKSRQGEFEYLFTYWAVANKVIELTPQSTELLFNPEKHRIITVDDCMQYAVEFAGKKGIFIDGRIVPELAGAKITVVAKDGSLKPIVLETSLDGRYRVGPLHGHTDYEVHAEKPGYVLTRNAADVNSFDAFKLAEISVFVVDDQDNAPLSGVLVSLSGHSDYRRNSLTLKDGKMQFTELGPGQYHLRAMMKEFRFEPLSQMVEIKEGTNASVVLKGKRIAFSCYGVVKTLNGESEAGLLVEAVGLDDCKGTQEEVKTEADGTFRIRGLQPNCDYDVHLKRPADVNDHIERLSPEARTVRIIQGDVTDVKFIAFRPVLRMDITGTVDTSKEYSSSLKVRLSRDDGKDQTYSLAHGNFFQFLSLPMDGRTYILSLETTLSRTSYDISSFQEVTFIANEPFKNFLLKFQPKPRNTDNELGQGSYFALLLALITVISVFNYTKIIPLLKKLLSILHNLFYNLLKLKDEVSGGNHGVNYNSNYFPNLLAATNMKKKVKPRKTQ